MFNWQSLNHQHFESKHLESDWGSETLAMASLQDKLSYGELPKETLLLKECADVGNLTE